MRNREDLVNTEKYVQALKREKERNRKRFNKLFIGWVVFWLFSIIPVWIISKDFSFVAPIAIIFVLVLALAKLSDLIKERQKHSIIEIRVDKKEKYIDCEGCHTVSIYEEKNRFIVDNNELYSKINEGSTYIFVCRKKIIVDILEI
jgi:hypothetical protein